MITYSPRAAMMPAISALPYPFSGIGTTRAPASSASWRLPSVEPLSDNTTSPSTTLSAMNRTALCTQVATVSASLRQGMTIVNSTWTPFAYYGDTRTGCALFAVHCSAPGLGTGGYGLEGNACGDMAAAERGGGPGQPCRG